MGKVWWRWLHQRITKPPDQNIDSVTPRIGDNYLNIDLMPQQGDTMQRGRVISRECDAMGDPAGYANANPILDLRRYDVEFDDGQVTELVANAIAESIYT